MNKLNVVLILSFISLFGKTQTVGGVHISEIDAEYVELLGSSLLLKPFQVQITVNYGQYGSLKEAKDTGLKDSQGNLLRVNGMMGAVNLFAKNGWELHSTMLLTVNNKQVYHYILKKKSQNNSLKFGLSNSNDSLIENVSKTTLEKSNNESTFLEYEPKYKIGQTVYFYKKGSLIESKIIYIDTVGKMCSTGCLKVQYKDSDNDNTKTKYITFDKVVQM